MQMENIQRLARDAHEARLADEEAERLLQDERERRNARSQHARPPPHGWSPSNHRETPSPGPVPVDWEERWETFEAAVAAGRCGVGLATIPFPSAPDIAQAATCAKCRRKFFRRLALRWHPDKFLQRYTEALRDEERALTLIPPLSLALSS